MAALLEPPPESVCGAGRAFAPTSRTAAKVRMLRRKYIACSLPLSRVYRLTGYLKWTEMDWIKREEIKREGMIEAREPAPHFFPRIGDK